MTLKDFMNMVVRYTFDHPEHLEKEVIDNEGQKVTTIEHVKEYYDGKYIQVG